MKLSNMGLWVGLMSLFISTVVHAQSLKLKVGLFAEPIAGVNTGSYRVEGNTDTGKLESRYLGSRAGLRFGRVFVGGEALESFEDAASDRTLTTSELAQTPLVNDQVSSLGATLGINIFRVALFATYYFKEDATTSVNNGSDIYDFIYHGTGYKASIGLRLVRNMYLNLNYHKRQYDRYTSRNPADLVDKVQLNNKLESETFGVSMSYRLSLDAF